VLIPEPERVCTGTTASGHSSGLLLAMLGVIGLGLAMRRGYACVCVYIYREEKKATMHLVQLMVGYIYGFGNINYAQI
jgi:hypothetical protein